MSETNARTGVKRRPSERAWADRPRLAAALAAFAAGFAVLAAGSLAAMRADRSQGPLVVAARAGMLEAALAAADARAGGGRAVYFITAPDCAACADVALEELAGLPAPVRVISGAEPDGRAVIAALEAVVAANGAAMAPPAVFWRSGREWRAAIGPDPRPYRQMRRDLAQAAAG